VLQGPTVLENELQAYEGLALQYYYMGNLKKSDYYFDRFTRGKFETKYSLVRKISTQALERQENLGYRFK
jgi:hypothetical protein